MRLFDKLVCSFGAAETLDAVLRFKIYAKESAKHDQVTVTARAELGKEAFAEAYEQGKNLTLDEAVTYAPEEY